MVVRISRRRLFIVNTRGNWFVSLCHSFSPNLSLGLVMVVYLASFHDVEFAIYVYFFLVIHFTLRYKGRTHLITLKCSSDLGW